MTGKPWGQLPSPEQRVVLTALRVDDERGGGLRAQLVPGLDWDSIVQESLRHAVLPLVYTRLKAAAEDVAPPVAMARLRELYLCNVRRNLRLTRELVSIVQLLSDEGIEAIPFKGPVLAERAYGDVTLRQFGDLDILIHARDLRRACQLLAAKGYESPIVVDAKRARWLARSGAEVSLCRGTERLNLRWSLARDFMMAVRAPVQVYWEDMRSATVEGTRVNVCSPEATMLLLCVHAASHAFGGLKWIADVAHFATTEAGLKWDHLTGVAARYGVSRIVNLALWLASSVCGLELPAPVLADVRQDKTIFGLADRVMGHLLGATAEPGTLASLAFFLRMRERWRDRVLSCVEAMFSLKEGDFAGVDLPRLLYPLYFAIRPVRLLREAALRSL